MTTQLDHIKQLIQNAEYEQARTILNTLPDDEETQNLLAFVDMMDKPIQTLDTSDAKPSPEEPTTFPVPKPFQVIIEQTQKLIGIFAGTALLSGLILGISWAILISGNYPYSFILVIGYGISFGLFAYTLSAALSRIYPTLHKKRLWAFITFNAFSALIVTMLARDTNNPLLINFIHILQGLITTYILVNQQMPGFHIHPSLAPFSAIALVLFFLSYLNMILLPLVDQMMTLSPSTATLFISIIIAGLINGVLLSTIIILSFNTSQKLAEQKH